MYWRLAKPGFIPDHSVCLNGYNIIRKDRICGRGGGVCFYVSNAIKFKPVILNVHYDSFECLAIIVQLQSKSVLLCCVYRSSSLKNYADFMKDFEDLLSIYRLILLADVFLCLGDMNINLLDVGSSVVQQYLNLFEAFNLHQVVNEPTRISLNALTLIDHIVTSDLSFINSVSVASNHSISDHCVVSCVLAEIRSDADGPELFQFRSFRNFDIDKFLSDLQNMNLGRIYDATDVDITVCLLNEILLETFDKHAPVITHKFTKPKAPWLSDNLRYMMDLRNKALARLKKN